MRLSGVKGDSGYEPHENLMKKGLTAKVYLDGQKVKYCLTADEEKGFVFKVKQDKYGFPVSEDGELVTEEVKGVVKIEVVMR